MNDADLYAAIQADPEAASLASAGDDTGCAARVSASLPPLRGVASANQILIFGATTGALSSVESRKSDSTPLPGTTTTVGSVCLAVLGLLQYGGPFDTANPANQQLVGALVGAGVISEAQGSALLNLAPVPQVVVADDVSRAMSPYRTRPTP